MGWECGGKAGRHGQAGFVSNRSRRAVSTDEGGKGVGCRGTHTGIKL